MSKPKYPTFVEATRGLNYPANGSPGFILTLREEERIIFKLKRRQGSDRRRRPAVELVSEAIMWTPSKGFRIRSSHLEKGVAIPADSYYTRLGYLNTPDINRLRPAFLRLQVLTTLLKFVTEVAKTYIKFSYPVPVQGEVGGLDGPLMLRTLLVVQGELMFEENGNEQARMEASALDLASLQALVGLFADRSHLPPPFNVPDQPAPTSRKAEAAHTPVEVVSVPKALISQVALLLFAAGDRNSEDSFKRNCYETWVLLDRHLRSDLGTDEFLALFTKLEPELNALLAGCPAPSERTPYLPVLPAPIPVPPAQVTLHKDGSLTVSGTVNLVVEHSKS